MNFSVLNRFDEGIFSSRLFSADQMSTMVLVPNIFDRTFNIYTHMGQLMKEDGPSGSALFNLSEDIMAKQLNKHNNLANDYNSQLYFRGFNT